jgi:hypothetical protein
MFGRQASLSDNREIERYPYLDVRERMLTQLAGCLAGVLHDSFSLNPTLTAAKRRIDPVRFKFYAQ